MITSFLRLKKNLTDTIKQTEYGNRKFYQIKQKLGKNPIPDIDYPELISIEVSSICNMSCSHCPPHLKEFSQQTRKHNYIDYVLFESLMNDIDEHGTREIALHKDGEPLLHPRIIDILNRVKKNNSHFVYLTTNGQNLNEIITRSILEYKIDVVNLSIGAYSEEFYKKVRGKGFNKVLGNIHTFLANVEKSSWKPKIIAQIINLPEYPEMKKEIKEFKKYWQKYNIEVAVWKKLTWGTFKPDKLLPYRYPCYSLWHSFNINSNGAVTGCCMDWQQELIIGNVYNKNINEIWTGESLKELRLKHINGEEGTIDACRICNYWNWQPMLLKYP